IFAITGESLSGNVSLQSAYMAPTEVLATQLFESIISYFEGTGLSIGLITGSGCRKFPSKTNPRAWTTISRAQLLTWVKEGAIHVLVGTHAIIQKNVSFKNLAYVIIDEQHRFGTKQRARLVKKSSGATVMPHFLSMTATPIPRTLALTIYGDLDLTLLDEMPAGRKPVVTEIVGARDRDIIYGTINGKIAEGRQAYVICPRIDCPDPEKALALNVKSVKEEAARLKKHIFPSCAIEIMHSKMTPAKKEEAMNSFRDGKTNILVSTSVIEVGVNVPNATIIIIEGAERFGLAQLHQLRGRVLRSAHQAYCYIFADAKSKQTLDRIKALKTAKNGFELAELDLMLRGAGELSGEKQWGISDIGMEAIKNIKMVEAAREEARALLASGLLKDYPEIEKRLRERTGAIHLE
ncbi:DEAD/DEAH box helicase, partial [bacterium]|nr:DEAD/DEAH box helicase [bacterium]